MKFLLFSKNYCIKVLSGLSAVLYFLARQYVIDISINLADLGVGLAAAIAVVLFLPVRGEDVKPSLVIALAGTLLPSMAGLLFMNPVHVLAVILIFSCVFHSFLIKLKYWKIHDLFMNEYPWRSLECDARLFYLLFFYHLCFFLIIAIGTGSPGFICVICILLSMLYLLMLFRSFFGSTGLVSLQKEKRIKDRIRGMVPAVSFPDEEADAEKMKRLYDKVLVLMDKKKPFLDEEYSLPDMAASLYSNKSYLSRTINAYSGRNFCQFVNYYRIMYSVELMKKDPHLRVMEIALMSGFHTVVTFNMAFKLNMSITPSEYIAKIRIESREDPSSSQARELQSPSPIS